MKTPNMETDLSTSQRTNVGTRVFIVAAGLIASISVVASLIVSIDPEPTEQGGTVYTPVTMNVNSLKLAANNDHALAAINGQLWAWGRNSFGQIGDGTATMVQYNHDRYVPVRVSIDTGLTFTEVAVGTHSMALQNNGAIWAWGNNQSKQLGLSAASPCGEVSQCSSPQLVDNWTGGVAPVVTQVAAGSDFSLALDNQGKVWTWGNNESSQLGYPTTTVCQEKPCGIIAKQIPNFPAVGRRIVAISAQASFSLALDDAGTVYAWGRNENGQLGFGDANTRLVPTAIPAPMPAGIKKISAGRDFGMALEDPDGDGVGRVWVWGSERLGTDAVEGVNQRVPNLIPNLTLATDIQAGSLHGVIRSTNNLLTVLANTTTYLDEDFGAVTFFAAGYNSTYGVKSVDQKMYAKGENADGTLGVPVVGALNQFLQPNTAYTFKVRAFDPSKNASAYSTSVSATTSTNLDTAAPSVPAGLQALPAPTSKLVNLKWTAATDTGGSGLAWYEIYRDAETTPIARLISGLYSPTTTYYDYTVEPSRTYSYKIRAIDNAGNSSALSAPLSVSTTAATETILPTKPLNLRATLTTFNQINITWDESTDASGISGYEVYRNGVIVPGLQINQLVDEWLAPNTTYTYTIKAVDLAGNRSVLSDPLVITTTQSFDAIPPTTPVNIQATPWASNLMYVTWNMPYDRSNLSRYEVWRNSGLVDVSYLTPNGLISINSPKVLEFGAPGGTGEVGLSAPVYQQSQVTLSWTAPTDQIGLTEYRVYRRLSGTTSFSRLATIPVATRSYSDTTIANAKTYEYKVAAVTQANSSTIEHSTSKTMSVQTKKK